MKENFTKTQKDLNDCEKHLNRAAIDIFAYQQKELENSEYLQVLISHVKEREDLIQILSGEKHGFKKRIKYLEGILSKLDFPEKAAALDQVLYMRALHTDCDEFTSADDCRKNMPRR